MSVQYSEMQWLNLLSASLRQRPHETNRRETSESDPMVSLD